MKLLKSPHGLLLSILLMGLMGFFSIDVYSITRVIRPNLHKGMQGGENCVMKSSNGSASQLNEINCMLNPKSCIHKIAWYQNRDNSMSPVSTKKGVGAAMATIFSKKGKSQGIQVCPGVYLATAHGALDSPQEARKEGRALRDPNNNMRYIYPYPMSDDKYMKIENARFTSLRLRDPSTWRDPSTDYVFIKVDNPLKPNHFVRPVRSSNQRLVDASRRGEIDVHLYRPKTVFYTDSEGTPIFSKGSQAKTFEQFSSLYDAPMRVNQPCQSQTFQGYEGLIELFFAFFKKTVYQTVQGYEGLIGSDCPSEQGVSGSPEVTSINGQDYLVGMHIHGRAISEESFEETPAPNAFVPSSHFCKDYESVCGRSCVELDEALSQKNI